MAKQKRKLSRKEEAEKAWRTADFMIVFINGKQKRVRRPYLIDGTDLDEFIRRNADPIWLHQEGMWEYITPELLGHASSTDRDDPDEPSVTEPRASAPDRALHQPGFGKKKLR